MALNEPPAPPLTATAAVVFVAAGGFGPPPLIPLFAVLVQQFVHLW